MDERISRLMDGDLDDPQIEAVFGDLKRPDGVATWVCYHVIGDTLRRSGVPTPGFAERFSARLAAEPTVLAPKPREVHRLPRLWAAAATIAAVLVVGSVAVSTLQPQPSVIAKARQTIAARAAQPKVQVVSPDYLLAHQEYSPTTQIQGVGPYLRAVSAGGVDGRQ